MPEDQSRGNVDLLWGVRADTTASLLAYVNPYFSYEDFVVNRRFDVRQPEAQRFMDNWCRTLHESELVQKVKNRRCAMQDFRKHVEEVLYKRFPVKVEEFDEAFESFLLQTNKESMQAGLVGFARQNQCRILFMGASVRADFKKSKGAWEMLAVWDEWQRLLDRKNSVAPSTVGGAIIVSDQFVSMATQVEAIMSTALSIWLACVLVVFIVVICTGSLQMAILILINLMFIVVFVVAGIAYLVRGLFFLFLSDKTRISFFIFQSFYFYQTCIIKSCSH